MRRIPILLAIAMLCAAQSRNKGGIDRSSLDPTCKPCQDFYRYATGGWADKNPIPTDRARWGTFDELADANLERERTILDASSAPGITGDQKRLGDFYSACMNTHAIEVAGMKPLQPILDRIAAIETRQDLAAFLVSLELDQALAPSRIESAPDPDNAEQVITWIRVGGLSLPEREYYFRDDAATIKIRDAFSEYVARMEQLTGESPEVAAAAAKTVFAFERVLAQARLTAVQRRDPYQKTHKMEFAKLKELAPHYDWDAAFGILNIPTGVPINVAQPEFMKTFDAQLESAPIATWKTWLKWSVIDGQGQFLAKAFYDASFHFHSTVLSGITEEQPRWKTCVADADRSLGDTLGKLYMEKYFPAESQRRMQQLIVNMRAALADELRTADWLEPETRKNALLKLDSFDPRIGGTVKFRSYADVQVARDGYLAAKDSVELDLRRFDVAKIGKPVDRTEWSMTPPTVNAYYNPPANSITFPAGILQFPFFEADADDALNYGAIGAVIGHEMGHGFDDQGSKYDAAGNLKNWWTDQDKANFEKRAACVTNQFEITDVGGGAHHTGKLVTGEAMGDLGGLTLAYKAYHKALAGKTAPVIDGFTGDQRFFLAFARVWAGSQREEAQRRQLATDPHPLAKYRVNSTLENMPEFHAAFGCKQGDAMVRPASQQCRLW
jgi:endothelin-converting enzyme/putative endopeptidase